MAKNKKGAQARHSRCWTGTGTAHGSARDGTADATDRPRGLRNTVAHLQIELVKLQRHFIKCNGRILILLEEGTAQGQQHQAAAGRTPESSNTKVVALESPPTGISTGWYFQRYVLHSWRRARCSSRSSRAQPCGRGTGDGLLYRQRGRGADQCRFEEMLVNSGIKLLKYYLDIGKKEQSRFGSGNAAVILKRVEVEPGAVALKHGTVYTGARRDVRVRTRPAAAPGLSCADNKRLARLNLIETSPAACAGKKLKVIAPDREIVFEFSRDCLDSRPRLAR